MKQNGENFSQRLRVVIVVILILGIFFRFVNLGKKVYWYDETYTSLWISGYTESELVQQVFDGREFSVKDLQKYQGVNSEKGVFDTIKGLATEDPDHPPLYYILARFWVQLFGNSVAVTRSFSAAISLLAFPCIYWVCLELFKSSLAGWVAIALIAVSPFHVVYAHEARPYTLWGVTILLSSAALLQAMRVNTKLKWGIYAATVAVGLYTFPLSVLVAIGHGIYVVASVGFRWSEKVTAYLLASLAGFLAFAPWVAVVIANLTAFQNAISTKNSVKFSLLSLVKQWANGIKNVFFDIPIGPYLTPLILMMVGYSLYFLWDKNSKEVGLFVFTLIGVPAMALILPDLIRGGQLSAANRYLVPCYLGIQLAAIHLFANKMISGSLSQKKLWRSLFAVLIVSGVASSAINSQGEHSFSKLSERGNPHIARIINQAPAPLIISDASDFRRFTLISLSHQLQPKVRVRWIVNPKKLPSTDRFSDVFLFKPSQELRDEFNKNYKLEPIDLEPVQESDQIWSVKKNNKSSSRL